MRPPWRVSPIAQADREAVSAFVRSATWQYVHFDYPRDEALSRPGYQAHNRAGARVGVLACGIDALPVARILFAAVDSRERPQQVVSALLEPGVRDMREAGATALAFLGWSPWLARVLARIGFDTRTTVITYSRQAGGALAQGNLDVRVRPALTTDVDTLVELDRAAFEPLWRYSASMHRRLVASAAHCTIAEYDGMPVGYQTGDVARDQGHIIRLAVHPDWQGRGVGTRLLADAIEFFRLIKAQAVLVNTQIDNAASRRLYERAGFVRLAEDVPVLVKDLDSREGIT
jgi:ribosomal protein S18 acetylase RimI-like enzyme